MNRMIFAIPRRQVTAAIALGIMIGLAAACAHPSTKQRAVQSLQATHVALANADDFERQLYAAKTLPALTLEKHQAFSRVLSKAYDDEIVAGTALKAWRAGEPAPTSLAALQKDADDALAVVVGIAPQTSELVGRVQRVLDEILKVVNTIKNGGQ